jgi:hypothetical protein
MISISCNVNGLDSLANLIGKLNVNAKEIIPEVIVEELWKFAELVYSDPDVPDEYKESLSLSVVPNLDTVVLYAYSPDKWKYKDFGNRLEWAIYRCPRRKYFGGKLSREYNGPDYLQEKWSSYKATFISNVKQRVVQSLRR